MFPKKQYPFLKLNEFCLAEDCDFAFHSERVTLLRVHPAKARIVHPQLRPHQPALYPRLNLVKRFLLRHEGLYPCSFLSGLVGPIIGCLLVVGVEVTLVGGLEFVISFFD